MKRFKFVVAVLFLTIMGACATGKNGNGQNQRSVVSNPLYDTIYRLDSSLFAAFNNRDISNLKSFFSEDLEFYHDAGGVTNYKQNMDAFERTFQSQRILRRELVRSSFEVSPIKDYGAVETGMHRFYVTENGEKEKLSSEAKFVQLWQNKNGSWKVTKIISYSHIEHLK